MDHYTRSFPTDAQQAPGMGDRDPPDFLAFLVEANLLPLATYLQLQNRALDGKVSESDTLISLGLIEPTRLAQLHSEHLVEGYIDLTHVPPNPDFLKILGPATALQMGVLPWRLSTGVTVILTDRPEHYDQNQAYLRQIFCPLGRAYISTSHWDQWPPTKASSSCSTNPFTGTKPPMGYRWPPRRRSPLPSLSASIMFQAGNKGLAQMPFHRLMGRRTIPIRNCRHNCLMLIQGHRPPPLNGKRGCRQERH